MSTWSGRAYPGSTVHFFGHVHSSPYKRFISQKESCDVGVDKWEFSPVFIDDAIDMARSDSDKINTINQFDEAE